MTREEIMQLNTDYLNGCESEHKMNELFSYALSQEPQCTEHPCLGTLCRYYKEPCDDAISRDAAIDAIESWLSCCNYNKAERHIMRAMQSILYDLPPVTQKSGKWILLDECTNSGYYCSNCQKKLVKEGWSNTVKKIKYCPNCGAKMESEVNNG